MNMLSKFKNLIKIFAKKKKPDCIPCSLVIRREVRGEIDSDCKTVFYDKDKIECVLFCKYFGEQVLNTKKFINCKFFISNLLELNTRECLQIIENKLNREWSIKTAVISALAGAIVGGAISILTTIIK